MKNTVFKGLERLVEAVLRQRVAVLLAVLVVTAVMGVLAARIEVKTVFSDLLPKNHPYVEINNRFKQTFGGCAATLAVSAA